MEMFLKVTVKRLRELWFFSLIFSPVEESDWSFSLGVTEVFGVGNSWPAIIYRAMLISRRGWNSNE
jgi:hypothetical protein